MIHLVSRTNMIQDSPKFDTENINFCIRFWCRDGKLLEEEKKQEQLMTELDDCTQLHEKLRAETAEREQFLQASLPAIVL